MTSPTRGAAPEVSVVVPLYNEVGGVRPLYEALVSALTDTVSSFEIVLVDDGSSDDTFDGAAGLTRQDPRVRVVKLQSNFGQTAALHAGIARARGNVLVTMDGDLQNDPRDIPRLLAKLREGYDVVAGYRANRKDGYFTRNIPSRVANWLVRRAAGADIIDNGCALRAYRADVIQQFPMYSDMHRLLPTLLALTGVRMAQLEVLHHPRRYGTSSYGFGRVHRVLFDLCALLMVLTAVRQPLFGFGVAGTLSAVLGAVVAGGAWLFSGGMPDAPLVVPMGAALLLWSLAACLWLLGVLLVLIYAYADHTIDDLLAGYRS